MAYKQKGWSAFTKGFGLTERQRQREAESSAKWYDKTAEKKERKGDVAKAKGKDKKAERKYRKAERLRGLAEEERSAFTSSENYEGGVMKQTYGTVSPMKKETKVEGSKYDKGGVGNINKHQAKHDADMAAYDKLPTWKKMFKTPPNITTGYAPGVGGKGKASKKILDTFNKIAKNRAKQNKIIQKSLEEKGYIFKDSPMKKKTDPVKKPVGPITPTTRAEYMNRQVFNMIQDNPDGYDRISSVKDQIKDLQQDIVKLKNRNNRGDAQRIKTIQNEIKRLKNK